MPADRTDSDTAAAVPVAVAVLGPITITVAGVAVPPGGPKQRAVLAALALEAGRTVPVERLVEIVWDGDAHDGAIGTVQTYVAGLRKLLEPNRARRSEATLLRSAGTGYVLDLGDGLDLTRFRSAQSRVRAATKPAETVTAATAGLDAWRGDAFADLGRSTFFEGARHRLETERLELAGTRVEANLELARYDEVISEARDVLGAQPYREPLWEALAAALYRAGRQGEALAAIGEARATLLDGLGIDPGPGLAELELAVLNQSPVRPRRQTPERAVPIGASTIPASRHAAASEASLRFDDGHQLPLEGRSVLIGRSASCDLHLDDARASREHAVIEPIGGIGWQVRDLGSLNGTLVNGEPVVSARLRSGDRIVVGSTCIRFETTDQGASGPAV
jgi:DNA-binding SARP family transcriptional activator